MRLRLPRGERAIALLLVAPAIFLMLLVMIYPFLYAIWISFNDWEPAIHKFVGLRNYVDLLTADPRFANSVYNTLFYLGSALTLEFVSGLGLAVLFAESFKLKKMVSVVILIPMMVAPVVVGFTWRMLFHMIYGPVNWLLGLITSSTVRIVWLSQAGPALVTILLAEYWQWTPFVFMVFLAAVTSLPQEPLEAAKIDGASSWQTFRYVKAPLLKPVALVVILLRGLAITQMFDYVALATKGGPGISTETISYYIFQLSWAYGNMGYAAAGAFLFFVVVTVVTTLFIRITRAGWVAS